MSAIQSRQEVAARPQRILGVDPGLNRTGYAIIERSSAAPRLREGGLIRSTPKLPLAQRVLELGRGLREVIEEFKPEVLVIEQVFSTAKYPKTAILMAHARGALLYAAADANLSVVHYTPTQIKRLLTGSGHATKDQIQRAIQHELNLDQILEPNDVADACAAALCHFHCSKLSVFEQSQSEIDE